jgi:hypothetical protein
MGALPCLPASWSYFLPKTKPSGLNMVFLIRIDDHKKVPAFVQTNHNEAASELSQAL